MTETIVIAEAGVNHNGSMKRAKQMIEVAASAGAHYVKFQTFKAESLVSKVADLAEYQRENAPEYQNQYDMLKSFELSYENFEELKRHCEDLNIKFLSTAFDHESVHFLRELGMDFFKVPSGEITNRPYLELIAQTGLPVVISTGMATLGEIAEALEVFRQANYEKGQLSLLHCNTAYPTPLGDVHLRAMQTLKEKFQVRIGYSDHTEGILVPLMAVTCGAEIIEKHFTMDKNLPGPDHKASLEPQELREMISMMKKVETVLGSFEKKPSTSELVNRKAARKSLFAAKEIKKGEVFSEQNLIAQRPGDGISPMKWREYLGKPADRNYLAGEKIR